ncbi:MAG: creatininase family protein [Aphanocapsa feldmannii 277cV]|uniref:Creatininase family protein n=2 Tax=Aphanocapsa feldmannii TaxID=192050 RepID=A0A524RNW5_9CHRO|nr:MAG: creatininase family protein [Aphanocapsa feldmannii 277cV]TGH26856.1 MAG: creatininase family protein [Aphanocapsa feldmannii 277cI]
MNSDAFSAEHLRQAARSRGLQHLPWPAAAAAARHPGSTVVLPFGSCEQHGPHLPLCTDALFAERLLADVLTALPADAPIWTLPTEQLGFSPEHLGFPGTVSLAAEVLMARLEAIVRSLAEAGFSRLVLFNAHGGQIALLEAAARQCRQRHPGLLLLPWFLWSLEGVMELIPQPERSDGLHAGLVETSLMLHLAPDLVISEEIPAAPDGQLQPPAGHSLEGTRPAVWLAHELSRSGMVGDARGASAELGAALHSRLVAGWCRHFRSLLDSSWPAMPATTRPPGPTARPAVAREEDSCTSLPDRNR